MGKSRRDAENRPCAYAGLAKRITGVACLAAVGSLLPACGGDSAVPPSTPGNASMTDASLDGGLSGEAALVDDDASVPSDASPDATVDGATGPDSGPTGPLSTIHYLGRFDATDPAGPRCSWPGSAIAATFTGTAIAVKLSDSGGNIFVSVIDDGPPKTVPTSGSKQSYTLASGLTAGQHTLVLTKRTESNVGVVQFLGLTPTGGALVPSHEPFTRRIEVIGDSISCGYGDLGTVPTCHFSAATEDETTAYGALTASQLDAQQTVIAYSGIGMYRNVDGTTATNTMPQRYQRTLADDASSVWGFTTPQPDVIVVALGTNDFSGGDPGPGFTTAYVSFLQMLRTHYATASILCMSSPMLSDARRASSDADLRAIVQQVNGAGDTKVSLVTVPGSGDGGTDLLFATQNQNADGVGCDYHPSVKTHQHMAAGLVPAIRALTGW